MDKWTRHDIQLHETNFKQCLRRIIRQFNKYTCPPQNKGMYQYTAALLSFRGEPDYKFYSWRTKNFNSNFIQIDPHKTLMNNFYNEKKFH